MLLGERIKKVRNDAHEKQETFAQKIGLARSSISLLESNKINPAENTIKLICQVYNVSYDWLKNGTGNPYLENDDVDALIATILSNEDSSVREVFKVCAKTLDENDWNDILRIIRKLSKNI